LILFVFSSTFKVLMIFQHYTKIIALFLLAVMVAGSCVMGTAPEPALPSVQGQSTQPSVSEIKRALATLALTTGISGVGWIVAGARVDA
jgi:hypothetical protein